MFPNAKELWRWTLLIASAIWWVLCLPFTIVKLVFRALSYGWRKLNAGLDWLWDSFFKLLWWLIGPIARPLGRLFIGFIWSPLSSLSRRFGARAARLVSVILGWIAGSAPGRACASIWQWTAPARNVLGETRPVRAVTGFLHGAWRVLMVIKPFWLPHGIWSAIGLFVVGFVTYKVYFWLQIVPDQMEPITKMVMDAIAGGYENFIYAIALPGVLILGAVMFVGKKLWPKNPNVEGLLLLGMVLMLMLSVNTLNVILNFANGAITDALNKREEATFYVMVYRLLSCFVIGTFIVVLYSFVRNRLALCWRRWLTGFVMTIYFANRNYYRINYDPTIDNPDERIQQDIDGVISSALSLLLTILGSIITYYTFVGILGSVDPTGYLTYIAYGWSAIFTVIAVFFGKQLVQLNFDKARREADFRYNLIHVRRNVESIAFYHAEDREHDQLRMRFKELMLNWSQLIGWTRNLGFLQTGSDYFTVAIPFLILGPLYFAGTIEMGAIPRSAMAFGQVLSALTLVVAEFGGISLFLARVNRLATFMEGLERKEDNGDASVIETNVGDKLAFNSVTLLTPGGKRVLFKDLDLEVSVGKSVLIMGPSGSGKSSALRSLAGLPMWNLGDGTITRPELGRMMFLPQVPYMLLGSLRDQLLYRSNKAYTEEELDAVLKLLNLPDFKQRYGGYDVVVPWHDVSPGEQQRIAFARLLLAKPEFAILDEATSALDELNEELVYELLNKSGIAYTSVGHRVTLLKHHRFVLRLDGKGGWTMNESEQYQG